MNTDIPLEAEGLVKTFRSVRAVDGLNLQVHAGEMVGLVGSDGAGKTTTIGVDPVARQEFWHLLVRLLRGGSAVLVSTPYMDEAMRFNRVIFMNRGRTLLDGTPRELINRLEGRVLELAAEPQVEARRVAAADPDVEDVQAFGDRLHLLVRAAAGPLARLPGTLAGAGIRLIHLKPVSPTLEDVFIQLLEK